MSAAARAPESVSGPRGESLAASVVILLVMTVVQRLIGFGRGILFCRWLDAEQLGTWDVAFGFMNLAAPMAVLGLPGSFGRYMEHFRQRGQFHTFLRRTTTVSLFMCGVASLSMVIAPAWFAQLIFGSADEAHLIPWLALCLAMVILHNFLTSLFISLRMYRFVTCLQFMQSFGFAVISLCILSMWPLGAVGAIVGYCTATAIAVIGSIGWLRRLGRSEPAAATPIPQAEFWAKLVPFAVWMWVTNVLINLFDCIDRYMIVHHSGMETHEALRQIGFYHSSRIVPLLFVAVAGLLGAMITPHLSLDWELGRREAVARRINSVIKFLSLAMFGGSIAVLFLAPWLFGVAFANKFAGGEALLPWTLAYCTWFGMIAVAQNYLWCAERAGLATSAIAIGLGVNITANYFLLPRFGLEGAVWATTSANLTALVLTYIYSGFLGMRCELGTWVFTLSPLMLCAGPWVALVWFALLLIASARGQFLLTLDEKQQMLSTLRQGWLKAQAIGKSILPGTAVAARGGSGPAA